MDNTYCYNFNENALKEIIVKIELERIDIQEEIIVEVLKGEYM